MTSIVTQLLEGGKSQNYLSVSPVSFFFLLRTYTQSINLLQIKLFDFFKKKDNWISENRIVVSGSSNSNVNGFIILLISFPCLFSCVFIE